MKQWKKTESRNQEGGKMERKINIGETRGIKRKIDDLGRITIPKEFRDALEVKEKDEVEIYLLQDGFFIKRIQI